MPKDAKRNIQNYQTEGGHVNEFEYQKNQAEMAREEEPPLNNERTEPKLTQAEHVEEVTAEAHRKVEERN